MSEFSDSFHFRGAPSSLADSKDRPRLIILAANDAWTTFLFRDVGFGRPAALAEIPGVALRWTFAEDHSWAAHLYDRGTLVFSYEVAWDPALGPATRTGSLPRAATLLGLSPFELSALLPGSEPDLEAALERGPAFASKLRLPLFRSVRSERVVRIETCDECGFSSPDRSDWICPVCKHQRL